MKNSHHAGLSVGQILLILLCAVLALILTAMIFGTAFVVDMLGQITYVPDGEETTLSPEQIESIYEEMWSTTDGTEWDEDDPDWTFDDEDIPSGEIIPSYTGDLNASDITIPSDTPPTLIRHDDIVNILLVGQDRRAHQTGNRRSDTMILVTFNTQEKTITMTSFMRDLYVAIPGRQGNRMNAAYRFGGMSLLCETMLVNFGVYVDGVIEVDFTSFQKIIDRLGGVTVNLTAKEANYLNSKYKMNVKKGNVHLDGAATLIYARIRKLDSDYQRTARQRKVLTQVINKCKNMDINELMFMMKELLPSVKTNMTQKEITNYVLTMLPLLPDAKVISLRIPASGMYASTRIRGMMVLAPDIPLTRQYLLEALMPGY